MMCGGAVGGDVFFGHDAERLESQVSLIFGVVPVISPIIGCWMLGWADWRAIFWFLSAFGLLVLLMVMLALPETHPRSARHSMRASDLWHGNVAMLRNDAFVRLSLIASCNFGALFVYISRSEEHTSELQSLMRISYAVFCL